MKKFPAAFLLLVVFFTVIHCAGAEDLTFFGGLPNPGKNWTVKSKGDGGDPSDWSWLTYINTESGDVLSFAARTLGSGEPPEPRALSDTALEIFAVDGYCVADKKVKSPFKPSTAWPIRRSVVPISFMDTARKKDIVHQALEYSVVVENEDGRPNRMAHGYAMLFDGISIYIQHTSTKPISYELAQEMAIDLVMIRSKLQPKAPES
jgi:hypothetical protein